MKNETIKAILGLILIVSLIIGIILTLMFYSIPPGEDEIICHYEYNNNTYTICYNIKYKQLSVYERDLMHTNIICCYIVKGDLQSAITNVRLKANARVLEMEESKKLVNKLRECCSKDPF